MPNIVVVGAQWGDEGKGKIIDILSERADYVVRYQGGSNAGHTIILGDKEFILHLIPSGIIRQGKICIIGNGVALDPISLVEEITFLKNKNIKVTPANLLISQNTHVIFPYHKVLDSLREDSSREGMSKIGTTKRGIGPCYADKVSRCGIRFIDLLNKEIFKEKLRFNIKEKNTLIKILYKHKGFSFDKIYKQYLVLAKKIKPFVTDTSVIINNAIRNKKNVLFEGAQGTLLDIDHGTYPFVTSSNATSGGACTGSGIGPVSINQVIGVVKAYTTRVGEGPFPTEFEAPLMEKIRNLGKEFGATTGRPRRCGWFDSVIVKHSVNINGIGKIAVTKLDVLDTMKKIKICTAYKFKGKTFSNFPSDLTILKNAKPIYEEHDGWLKDTSHLTNFNALPTNAKKYLHRLEELVNAKVSIVSVGSERKQTIFR